MARDAEKLAALKRTKFIATAALALCVVVFVLARIFADVSPLMGFIGAVAEAAAIGGLADWYAVVALFRHPLGLPIPHTAIIPRNQERIADNLGRFIQGNFLAADPVRKKLKEVDFAAMVADWLSDPARSDGLSRFVAKLVPKMLASVEGSGLREFAIRRVTDHLENVKLAPVAADLLSAFTQDRRHQKLLDELITLLARFLTDEAAKATLRDRIREELPTLARVFRADAYLLKKILNSAATLIEEIRAQEDHPIRDEFDRFVDGFIEQLRHSDAYAQQVEAMKRKFLARPELGKLGLTLWKEAKGMIAKDARAKNSALREHLSKMLVEVGRSLKEDDKVRADMNVGFVVALSSFIEAQKSSVATFISDQVRRWELTQLTHLIELNIGRDLQYIRFNGMVIGGLAGLALHTLDVLITAN